MSDTETKKDEGADETQHDHAVEHGLMAGHPPQEKAVDTSRAAGQPSMSLGEEHQLTKIDQQEAAKSAALKDAPKRPTKKQQEQIDAETAQAEATDRVLQRAQTDPAAEYLHRVDAGSDMAPPPDDQPDDDDGEDDLSAKEQRARVRAAVARDELRRSFGDYTLIPEGDRYRVEAMIDGDLTVAIFTLGEFASAQLAAEGRDAYIRDRLLEIAGKGA